MLAKNRETSIQPHRNEPQFVHPIALPKEIPLSNLARGNVRHWIARTIRNALPGRKKATQTYCIFQ